MKKYKIALAVLALFIAAMCIYPVSADVQTDESVFKVISFSGAITSPDGKETPFTSISDFKKCLENPIIAGSDVDIDTKIQLKGGIKDTYFLELSSDLTGISWDAEPNSAKPDTLWSDYSGTTYLWMTPSHSVGQIGMSIEGKTPQPTEEKILEPFGSRTLIKEKEISLLNIKVKDSTSTFTYAENPQMFVSRTDTPSVVFSGDAMATSEKIIETKKKIAEMNQALSDLSGSLARVGDRDETTRSLTGQYEAEKKIAETVERLFLEGYPDIASEMADDVRESILKTKGMVRLLPIETNVSKPLDATPFVISTIILAAVSIILACINYFNKKDHANRLDSAENYLKTHKGETVDQSFINEVIGRFKR